MTETNSVTLAGVDLGHVHWCSPDVVNAAVRKVARGRVALDPCSNLASTVNAHIEFFGKRQYHADDAERALRKLCKKLKQPVDPSQVIGVRAKAELDLERDLAAALAAGRNVHEKDGLAEIWAGMGLVNLVYVNSPYGAQELPRWQDKVFEEAKAGVEIIQLLPARTDTKRFHEALRGKADAVCFWGPGRIDFDNPPAGSDGGAPSIASAFYYFGRHGHEFSDAFSPHGKVFQISNRATIRRT